MNNHIGFSLTKTQYSCQTHDKSTNIKTADPCHLYYGRQPGVGWRFVIDQCGKAIVGKIYATKDELLSDLEDYAYSWGLQ